MVPFVMVTGLRIAASSPSPRQMRNAFVFSSPKRCLVSLSGIRSSTLWLALDDASKGVEGARSVHPVSRAAPELDPANGPVILFVEALEAAATRCVAIVLSCESPNSLDVHELTKAKASQLAAIARLLHATERVARVGRDHPIDEDGARFDTVGQLFGFHRIGRPHARPQAER